MNQEPVLRRVFSRQEASHPLVKELQRILRANPVMMELVQQHMQEAHYVSEDNNDIGKYEWQLEHVEALQRMLAAQIGEKEQNLLLCFVMLRERSPVEQQQGPMLRWMSQLLVRELEELNAENNEGYSVAKLILKDIKETKEDRDEHVKVAMEYWDKVEDLFKEFLFDPYETEYSDFQELVVEAVVALEDEQAAEDARIIDEDKENQDEPDQRSINIP